MNHPSTAPKRFGPYQILGEIARGGQGVVMKARHEQLGKTVALKMLLNQTPKGLQGFRQEAKVLSELEHPNLLRVTDLGERNGIAFLAMDFVEGDDLATFVEQKGIPELSWSIDVVLQVAQALDYCHSKGVVHRDLKPENVLIERETGKVILVDFGLVKRDPEQMHLTSLDSNAMLTKTGELKGTPKFMAPEQAAPNRFGRVSPLTDVYALGGVLYFLLTGEAPFTGESVISVIASVIGMPPPNATKTNNQTPVALARFCRRCLAKKQEDRPPSAAAFQEELAELADRTTLEDGVAAVSSSAKRALVLSMAVNALLAALLLTALALGWGKPSEPETGTEADPAAQELAWEDAQRLVGSGVALSEEQLACLDAASGDERWLPYLKAENAVLAGAPDAGAQVIDLPAGPERDVLRLELLLRSGTAEDLPKAAAFLETGEHAKLPWRTQGAAAHWERLARRLEAAGHAEQAAGAYLHSADRLLKADPMSKAAPARIERAWKVDAKGFADQASERVLSFLLASARRTLAAAKAPEHADGVARARLDLVRYRAARPSGQIPKAALDDLWRLGGDPDSRLRMAAMPGRNAFYKFSLELKALLERPVPDDDQLWRNVPGKKPINCPDAWETWFDRSQRGTNPRVRQFLCEEWSLWRPELAALWIHMAFSVQHFRMWRRAEIYWGVGRDREHNNRARMTWDLSHSILKQGRYEDAVAYMKEAARGMTLNRWQNETYANTLHLTGQSDEAWPILEKLISSKNAESPAYWQLRANVLEALGRTDEARRARDYMRRLFNKP